MNYINESNDFEPELLFPVGQVTPSVPPKSYALRQELMDIINSAVTERFVHLNAPAGSGKTISALLWLNSCKCKSVWIGLDQYGNVPKVFYKQLAAGICSIQPDNINMKNILSSPSFSSSPVESVIQLISKLKPDTGTYALVFDDLHLITNSEILRSLPSVLRKLPRSSAVLTLSRGTLPVELKPLFNESAIISVENLLFSESEIREYFDGIGRFLTPEEVRFVHTATGGLPVRVNAVSKNRRIDRGNPGGTLENYVKDQLWERWDKSLRDFMLKTCFTDELSAELASRLTGADNSGETLDRLCAANYFVIRTGGDYYRYHPLFLEFLRKQAGNISPSLYKVAGDYYFEHNHLYKALTYYIKSGDLTAVLSTLDKVTVYNASLSIAEHLSNMSLIDLEKLAENACDIHPFIFLRCAWKYYLLGDAKTMCAYFDEFYTLQGKVPSGNVNAIYTAIAISYLDHRKSLSDLHREAVELANKTGESGKQISLPVITMNMPFAHRSNRDASEYAFDIEGIDGIFSLNLRKTFGNLYDIYITLVRCGLYYEKNIIVEPDVSADSDMLWENPDFMFCHYMLEAAIAHAKGNIMGVHAAYSSMEMYINETHSEYLLPNYLAIKTRESLCNADEKAAEEWLAHYFVSEPDHLELYKIYQHFTTARAYIVLNQPAKAMRYILRLKRMGTDFRRPLDVAEASVLQSVLEWALGKRKDAIKTLEDTLTAIQPYGYISIIANEGASVLPILKRIGAKFGKKDHKSNLTQEYITAIIGTAQMHAKTSIGVASNIFSTEKQIKLSARQAQMLTLIAQGRRNSEIAEFAGLSVVTVKRHLTMLYAKLNASGSAEAIAKARERGLVE